MALVRHRHRILFPALCALTLLAAACGVKGSNAAASGSAGAAGGTHGQQMTLKVGYVVGTEVELFYALNQNLFAKHGLKVEPVQFTSGPPMLAALANGSVEVGVFGLPPDIGAVSKGVPFKIWDLADQASNLNGLYVNPKSGIKSVKDLRGKTIGTSPGTTADIIMHMAMQQEGVPFNSVKIKYLAPPALINAYAAGDVDGVWMWNNWGQRLIGKGAQLVANATQYNTGDPGIVVSTENVIQQKKAAMVAYLQTTNDAGKVINADPSAPSVVAALSKYSGLSPELSKQMMAQTKDPVITTSDLLDPGYTFSFKSANGFPRLAKDSADMLVKLKVLPKAPAVSQLYTTEIVDQLATH